MKQVIGAFVLLALVLAFFASLAGVGYTLWQKSQPQPCVASDPGAVATMLPYGAVARRVPNGEAGVPDPTRAGEMVCFETEASPR